MLLGPFVSGTYKDLGVGGLSGITVDIANVTHNATLDTINQIYSVTVNPSIDSVNKKINIGTALNPFFIDFTKNPPEPQQNIDIVVKAKDPLGCQSIINGKLSSMKHTKT